MAQIKILVFLIHVCGVSVYYNYGCYDKVT
jgi:hypothetical protein